MTFKIRESDSAISRPGIFAWPFLFAALALVALPQAARAQAIDWDGYCSPSAKRVLLLVDITTPYDTQDKQILVDGLQSIVGKLGDGDRIVIRTIAYRPLHALLPGHVFLG